MHTAVERADILLELAAVKRGDVDSSVPRISAALVAAAPLVEVLVSRSNSPSRIQCILRAVVATLISAREPHDLPEVLALDGPRLVALCTRARATALLAAFHAALRALGVAHPDLGALRSAGHNAHSSLEAAGAAQVIPQHRVFAEAVLARSIREPVDVLLRRVRVAAASGEVPLALVCVANDVVAIHKEVACVADLAAYIHCNRIEALLRDM